MEYGLGYIPDEPDVRDFSVSSLTLPEAPAAADLRHHVVEILNQGPLPSCVGQALPQAIRMVQKREEPAVEPPLTSRFWTWYYARLQHGDHEHRTGTSIRAAVKALNRLGRPPESAWPQVLSDLQDERPKYTRRPPPNVSMEAYDHRAIKYNRVYETGEARCREVKGCIAIGKPVVFGTDVGESFIHREGPTRNVPPPLSEPIAGGHAMVIAAYDAEGCWVVNSWGSGWRAGGLVHLSWDYILWGRTRDLWAMDL
jgi:hypothetical protein